MSSPEVTNNSPILMPNSIEPPPKAMLILSAIAIIAGLGGLAAFGIGFAVNSMVTIVAGGVVAFTLLITGIVVGLRYVATMATYNQDVESLHDQRDTELQQRQEFITECNGRLCQYPQYQIKGDNYFGIDKWKTHYGVEIADAPPIPQELLTYLETPCPFAQQEDIKVKDTHMVMYIPPGVTLRSFAQLPKNQNTAILDHLWGGSATVNIYPLLDNFDTIQIQRPYWLLMTRHTIPGSKLLSLERQQEVLTNLHYEVPQALEATICITSEFLSSASRIFIDNRNVTQDRTFTFCSDDFQNGFLVVGGTCPEGITVQSRNNPANDIGVAGVRRFYAD